MKLKIFLSSLILVLFGIMGGASVDKNGNIEGWFWLLIGCFVIILIAGMIKANSAEKQKREKEEASRKKRLEQEAEQTARFDEWQRKYIAENGFPDKTIIIEPNDPMGLINVHEAKELVYLNGEMYHFKDFLAVTATDNPTTIKGETTATTTSGTRSAVGRAIIGDVIAGPAGAIIGGATGKKTTKFHHEDDIVIHDYTVEITINSIATPIVRVYIGDDLETTNEIVALINVILTRV